jgi:3-methyladenine DNA glycosylase AlkD
MDVFMLRESLSTTIGFGAKRENAAAKFRLCGASVMSAAVKRMLSEMRHAAGTADRMARIDGMKRFGIVPQRAIGLTTPQLRQIARGILRTGGGPNQGLAEELWETGIHDARILASLVGDSAKIHRTVMDRWARDFASWDVCDACCCNLFDRSPHAWKQIAKWARSDDEYIRRAAFATIAASAVHDKAAKDEVFLKALPLIEKYAFDDRNFVRKAVNWALRNIGKRNAALRVEAMACAERVREQGTKSARWIAADALRELRAR